MEKDEDTYSALKIMAETIDLSSRNDNDEIIGLEYYVNFNVLTEDELGELIQLWEQKLVIASIVGVIGMIAMIEDKRVQKAKRNLSDAEKVCNKLRFHA